jgi:sodium-dependent dicarboxylate transporter 2/3/5
MLPFTWFWLTAVQFKLQKLHFANLEVWLKEYLTQREPMGLGEKMVLAVFFVAVVGWLVRQPLQERLGLPLSDSTIAIAAALLLFLVPAQRAPYQPVLDWQTAASIPWGVLILFGVGLRWRARSKARGWHAGLARA